MVQLNMCQPLTLLQIMAVQSVCVSSLHITDECTFDFTIFSNVSLCLSASLTGQIPILGPKVLALGYWSHVHVLKRRVRIGCDVTLLQCEKGLKKDLSFATCTSSRHSTVFNAIVSMRTRLQCTTSVAKRSRNSNSTTSIWQRATNDILQRIEYSKGYLSKSILNSFDCSTKSTKEVKWWLNEFYYLPYRVLVWIACFCVCICDHFIDLIIWLKLTWVSLRNLSWICKSSSARSSVVLLWDRP